jgi:hypothetical protein
MPINCASPPILNLKQEFIVAIPVAALIPALPHA